jgi:hypothetical protein
MSQKEGSQRSLKCVVGVEVGTMNLNERKPIAIEGVGLLGIENAHDKEFEDLPRPKASGTDENVEACQKANAPLEKIDELHEKDKHDDSPHNLEVADTKKSSGKSGKGKKIVLEKSRDEMKVKTQVQNLVYEYDLQSKMTK